MLGTTWIAATVATSRRQATSLEREICVAYLVLKHPGVPWYCRAVAAGAGAYQVSPITLIPDWVPVIGFLDNLLVLAGSLWLIERLTPKTIMQECRQLTTPSAARSETPPRIARAALLAVLVLKVALAVIATGAAIALLRSTPIGGWIPGV